MEEKEHLAYCMCMCVSANMEGDFWKAEHIVKMVW